ATLATPPGQEVVVALELVDVLVGALGAVVLDEQARSLAVRKRNLEERVRAHLARAAPQARRRPVVEQLQLPVARQLRRPHGGLALAPPGAQVCAELAPQREHPAVDLEVVADAAVVPDTRPPVAAAALDVASVNEGAVASSAEVVDPRIGALAAARVRTHALE